MSDKIRLGFESWAKANGFDVSGIGGRYNRPVVRWMWEAWQVQSEKIGDLTAALARSTKRNADLINQCRDHDTRRAIAVSMAAGLAAEVDRLNETIGIITSECRDATAV